MGEAGLISFNSARQKTKSQNLAILDLIFSPFVAL
jgi:hypothetical protein